MSDTSGRVNFGSLKGRIRREAHDYVSGGSQPASVGKGSEGAAAAAASEQTPIAAKVQALALGGVAKALVWTPLHVEKLLEKAFLESELIEYLKLLAESVELSSASGLDEVINRFNVKGNSALITLQIRIRGEVRDKISTEFAGAAARAFQTGSTKWATKLAHRSNPTRIKIQDLVKAVSKQVDDALISSPSLILQLYGERLLESALPGGDAHHKAVEDAKFSYRKQLAEFMKQHNDAQYWGSATIARTVKKFTGSLLM